VSSSASICYGCGGVLSSTVFCEGGEPYHFGCRPSQQVILSRVGCMFCPDKDARIAELEAENTHLSSLCDRLTKVNQGRVSDEAIALKRIAALETENERLKSFEIYEVFTADDGEPGTRPVDWPAKVAELEAELAERTEELACCNDGCQRREEECEALAERLNVRDRMLRLAYEDAEAPYATVKERGQWFADLRARAEEGSAK